MWCICAQNLWWFMISFVLPSRVVMLACSFSFEILEFFFSFVCKVSAAWNLCFWFPRSRAHFLSLSVTQTHFLPIRSVLVFFVKVWQVFAFNGHFPAHSKSLNTFFLLCRYNFEWKNEMNSDSVKCWQWIIRKTLRIKQPVNVRTKF